VRNRPNWLTHRLLGSRPTKSALFAFACLALFAAPITVRSQGDGNEMRTAATNNSKDQSIGKGIEKRWNEFGIWGAISFDATTLIGKTPDARFGNVGLRYGRVLAASKTVAFEWTIDAVPLAILANDRFSFVPTGSGGFVVQKTRKSVYAAGLSPIGLKFNFRRQHRVQPFASGTGGFLYFREDVPVDGATRFNFAFDFGGGVQIVNSSRRAFTVGYKYQHISNGDRSPINPGVDVQMIYAGFSVFR
jgi:opacity protein-like surface antigen